jgi:hypothetical protein
MLVLIIVVNVLQRVNNNKLYVSATKVPLRSCNVLATSRIGSQNQILQQKRLFNIDSLIDKATR